MPMHMTWVPGPTPYELYASRLNIAVEQGDAIPTEDLSQAMLAKSDSKCKQLDATPAIAVKGLWRTLCRFFKS